MQWFAIGGAVGVVLTWASILRRPVSIEHPWQGTIAAFVIGAATVGTILWLVFG